RERERERERELHENKTMNTKLLGFATQIMVMAILISVVLLFVGVGVLVLIHVCIVGRAFRRGFNTMTPPARDDGRSGGLSPDDLAKLPCYEFKGGEMVGATTDCAVCLESFQVGDGCRLLPACGHSFHAQCVDSWLLKSSICPICRTSADGGKGGKAGGGDGLEMREGQRVTAGVPHASSSQ
ncbi:unnamed protein product, partial [Musa banksii]